MFSTQSIDLFVEETSKFNFWEVIHEIPGRLRLRLAWLKEYPSLHFPLENALINLRYAREVRLSSMNNSIVVCYDHHSISPEHFKGDLFKVISLMTPQHWLNNYLNERGQTQEFMADEFIFEPTFLTEKWEENKQPILTGIGATCLLIGGVLVPLPLVPGWPLLLLGSYCLKLASEQPS